MEKTGGGNPLANRTSTGVTQGKWETDTQGDAAVKAVNDSVTIRVHKCSTGLAEREIGQGSFNIRFDYEIEAEQHWEVPFFEILENGDPVYTASVHEDGTIKERNDEKIFTLESYETVTGSIEKEWDASGPMGIRFALFPSNYCSSGDHANTYFRVKNLTVTQADGTVVESTATTSPTTTTTSVTSTSTPTRTSTSVETQTESPTPESTPTPTSTPIEAAYQFKKDNRRVVDVGGTEYYIYTEFPQAQDSVAVTDSNNSLVGRTETADALITHSFTSVDKFGYNWDKVRNAAKRRKEDARYYEILNQGAKLGVDVVEAYIAIRGSKKLEKISALYDVFTTAIDWALTEINDPYERAFTDMAATVQMPARLEEDMFTSIANDWDKATDVISLCMDIASSPTKGAAAIVQTASDYSGLSTKAEATLDGTVSYMAGSPMDAPVANFEEGLDVRARIGGILHAYESVRIPMMSTMEKLIPHLEGNSMHAGRALQFYQTFAAYQYIGGVAFKNTANLFRNLDELSGFLGGLWDAVDNTDEQITYFEEGAQKRLNASTHALSTLGYGFLDARDNYDRTINRMKYGDLEDDYFGGAW